MSDQAPVRRILHVDMDAFFASVEQRDRPELRGRPLAVGGSPEGRGVVAAASYEARRYGVRSAMPASMAARLCRDLVFVRPDFAKYKQASSEVFAIFREVTDLVEGLSLDEAYLDVTTNTLGLEFGRDVARWIKAEIRARTGLTASAGVAPNKFVAKVASDLRKPDGLVIVPPEHVRAFIADLEIEKIWGVGPATAKRLHGLGIRTGKDLRIADPALLERTLGRHGRFLHALAHGRDDRPVVPHRVARSRGAETTLEYDVTDIGVLRGLLEDLSDRVAASLTKMQRPGRTVTLKLRYGDFTTITRSRTLARATDDAASIAQTAYALMLEGTEAGKRPVRLIGVSVSGLSGGEGPEQLWLDLPLP